LQLIKIIIRSTIQISSISKKILNLFSINFRIINGHQKRQAKKEDVTWQHFNDNFIFIIIIFLTNF